MKILLKLTVASGLLFLGGYSAIAQTQHPRCPQSAKSYGIPGAAASLTGCPFSAIIERENTQILSDGTHIQQKFKALVYRDKAGRIRYETYAPTDVDKDFPETPNMIHIFDPVAGFWYILTPEPAVAARHRLRDPAINPSIDARPGQSSAPASVPTQKQDTEPDPIVENLGSKLIEGLVVTGRRITRTIPVSAEGNDRAITLVSEDWTSNEMGITLLRKSSDPRTGELVARMKDLNQMEPDPDLFQVPAEYTIRGD